MDASGKFLELFGSFRSFSIVPVQHTVGADRGKDSRADTSHEVSGTLGLALEGNWGGPELALAHRPTTIPSASFRVHYSCPSHNGCTALLTLRPLRSKVHNVERPAFRSSITKTSHPPRSVRQRSQGSHHYIAGRLAPKSRACCPAVNVASKIRETNGDVPFTGSTEKLLMRVENDPHRCKWREIMDTSGQRMKRGPILLCVSRAFGSRTWCRACLKNYNKHGKF